MADAPRPDEILVVMAIADRGGCLIGATLSQFGKDQSGVGHKSAHGCSWIPAPDEILRRPANPGTQAFLISPK
jgi:hypothetical protein